MNKLLIIDGNSILNRAFYGIRMLNAPDGTPTNAVYGFLNILFKQIEEMKPDGVCVAFDVKEKTFRHKMYDLYKAQRKPAPDDFIVQLPLMKEVLKAMNITCLENPGYEADDIIGTVSGICENSGVECNILTGDKDDLQLASELVKVNLVITRMGNTTTTVYDADAVFEKYGVTPLEFIDVKGLMGDTSDNIPGVAGIGEKTAFSLINEYKSIENIYENIETIEVTKSVREKLRIGQESAYLSKTLATIDRNVPGEYNIDEYALKEYSPEFADILARLNFKQFMSKLNIVNAKTEADKCDKVCQKVDESVLSELKSDIIFYKLYQNSNSLGLIDGEEYYYIENISDNALRKFFESENKKVGYSIKEDIISLKNKGILYNGLYFDVMIGAYISNPVRNSYELDEIALDFAGIDICAKTDSDNQQIMMNFGDETEVDSIENISGELYAIKRLYDIILDEIKKNNQEFLCFNIEMPLINVLADMQLEGVYIDKDALTEFGKMLDEKIYDSSEKIYEYAGRKFNINSPKQLGEVLFAEMGLPHGKKTKTGYSTNADILEKLKDVHPVIPNILNYRQFTKLKSTYVDGLLSVINPRTGRIHSNFNQTVTATGRISSTEPNLQNIPVRTQLGREMRKMFVAAEENVLVDADYSQIELRVLSHIADDENMKNAFINNVDIHTQTAAKVFNIPIDAVTSEMRTSAKAVNFGIVYGISEFSLAQDLKISFKESKKYIEDYFKSYPGIKKYLDDVIINGTNDGYVSTVFNRRRYMPELKSGNKITQAFGQRVAMNAPIQGTAADIIKIAMVNVYNSLKEHNLKSKLVLQIHDELIVEAYPDEIEEVKSIVKVEMENAAKLSVPLNVDLNIGKTWYDTK